MHKLVVVVFFFVVLLANNSCKENDQGIRGTTLSSRDWRLAHWRGHSVCTLTFCVDEPCVGSSNLFDKFLGLDGDSSTTTDIRFVNDEMFLIFENDHPVITGAMRIDSCSIALHHDSTQLVFALQHLSIDSLVVFVKNQEGGLRDVTATFFPVGVKR